ncbi:hypothetical protein [Cryptosporangium aurantiacum]|uniref:Uncharacterized protein n=1 Tax=Cryptosporangium aurantiacum TaxID=134849 RepID=A0A1M7NN20_9ACTN|nr:hypothetical protein [Cryptosporangium aurantiacum]SHN05188.1 hypothetical protein SAMN05443668_102730 [Cryptosporangium aurantiacum]
MYGTSIDSAYDVDGYLELAARIEWEEQGSVERPRSVEAPGVYALAAAEPLRG